MVYETSTYHAPDLQYQNSSKMKQKSIWPNLLILITHKTKLLLFHKIGTTSILRKVVSKVENRNSKTSTSKGLENLQYQKTSIDDIVEFASTRIVATML